MVRKAAEHVANERCAKYLDPHAQGIFAANLSNIAGVREALYMSFFKY
jgi:hypothetical protein